MPLIYFIFFFINCNAIKSKKWMDAIQGHLSKARRTRKDLHICEFHFISDDIETEYLTTLTNNIVSKIARKNKLLKFGAVPSVFEEESDEIYRGIHSVREVGIIILELDLFFLLFFTLYLFITFKILAYLYKM